MSAAIGDGTEPIEDDEIVYRRISVGSLWYDPVLQDISLNAFKPRREEESGISLMRAKYLNPERTAAGGPGKAYYIVEIRAGDLRHHHIGIEPDPLTDPDLPGHCQIPDLNIRNYNSSPLVVEGKMMLIASQLCGRVYGPFPGMGA